MNNQFPFSPNRNRFSLGQGAIIVLLLFILFGNVFYLGYRYYEVSTLSNKSEQKELEKMALIKKVLQENYLYSNEVPYEQMFDGAVHGMTSAMGDPYTRYVSEREYQEFKIQTEGTFGGIGVTVDTQSSNDGIIIANISEGEGADLAGLKPNDKIIEVDGKPIKGMDIQDAIALIRGEIGTSVTLKVEREGIDKPITVIVQRQQVELPNISHKMIDNKYGYIHMARFARNTSDQFDEAYKELEGKNMKALILDLRQNPGGLVTEASELASRILGSNQDLVIVKSKDYSNTIQTEEAPYSINVPLVVIVDQNSASASEIFAGSLKAHKKAKIIGETTYGKGLIQNTFKVDDESALIITISEYLTPDEKVIQGKGVTPDIEVTMNPEDLLKGIDTQLKKSIEYLDSELTGKVLD